MEQILTSYRYWLDRRYKNYKSSIIRPVIFTSIPTFYNGEAQQWWVKVPVFRRK